MKNFQTLCYIFMLILAFVMQDDGVVGLGTTVSIKNMLGVNRCLGPISCNFINISYLHTSPLRFKNFDFLASHHHYLSLLFSSVKKSSKLIPGGRNNLKISWKIQNRNLQNMKKGCVGWTKKNMPKFVVVPVATDYYYYYLMLLMDY